MLELELKTLPKRAIIPNNFPNESFADNAIIVKWLWGT